MSVPWPWDPECPFHASVDFPSIPALSFVQLRVMSLLIRERARMWTALSWQLLSGLRLVTQGKESLLVLVWLMELGRVCAGVGYSRVVASCLEQAVVGLRGRAW